MSTQNLNVVLDAEDRATEKLRQAQQAVDATAKRIVEMGEKTKATAELGGTLAVAFGGTTLGTISGQLAQLTERMSAFSRSTKDSAGATFLMKAGLVGAIAGGAYVAYKAVTDLAAKMLDLEGINKRLLDSGQRRARLAEGELNRELQLVDTLATSQEKQIRLQKIRNDQYYELRRLKRLATDDDDPELAAKFQAELDATRDRIERLNNEIKDLNFEPILAAAQEQQKMREDAEKLKAEFENQAAALERQLFALKEGQDELEKRDLLNSKFTDEQKTQIQQMRDQIAAQGELNRKKKEAEDIQKRIHNEMVRERQRIQDLGRSTTDQLRIEVEELLNGRDAAELLRLQMQGIEDETATRIVELKKQINSIKGGDGASTGDGPGSVGTQANTERLTSGRNRVAALQERIATNSDKTTKLAESQAATLRELLRELQILTSQDQGIGVVG